ncbi:secreted RxLR effector protein 78-like [Silene latifolia]|uniref:secreted RxLR effector protein 78-like n=1 Tax=Silene latifolia TaxID=37657 RepID=UPI003D773245
MVLPDIVSPSQGAFIKGRDIVGNILICQDLIKLYKRRSCSPRAMMKIDLQKAYDSVEWEFVGHMLEALGFPEKICRLVMQCITTPSYSLSLNGESFGFFRGRRGLRQGDPLSPLLFTVCLEYLSRVLMVVQKHSRFKFHPSARG